MRRAMANGDDYLIFRPADVDLRRSPLRRSLHAATYVLGAFNPGLTRLANGNLLLMVRVAEALREPVAEDHVRAIRWTEGGYVLDAYPLASVDMTDPRQFSLRGSAHRVLALTSLSWLLPVELTADGRAIVCVHYERAIAPTASYEEYGVEDARISKVDGLWYMTACSVSAERHCTTLHVSSDGLDFAPQGIVLDHQNKDMVLFEGKVAGKFVALTRPLGEVYFAYPEASAYASGPAIHLATSPDALHWKPCDRPGIRPRKRSTSSMKVGGGSPPIRTDAGWLVVYHGVEAHETIGIYRSFCALLDLEDPSQVLHLADEPLLEANPALTETMKDLMYLPTPVVFSSGIADGGDHYIVASGEADLACRITHIPKARFA
ncbi:MAG: glycosidase [Myxococcaceae bacterium]|nr:glycosidase [Myxococcaceae bacterium]